LTVEAGVSIGQLIDAVLPDGWFPAVVPGTRHVTVGGAIASDIHGKNHHRDGSFSEHVISLELLTPGGARVAEPGDEAFEATRGGMGLTGVVLRARLRLMRVDTSWMRVHTARMGNLDEVLEEMERHDRDFRYSVAWIDCLARGRQLGRSVLIRGDHARPDELPVRVRSDPVRPLAPAHLSAPRWAPNGLLRRSTVTAFNEFYFRRAPRRPRVHLQRLEAFFFPLDWVIGWNRLYGARGLLQYQFVMPFGSEAALRRALATLSGRGVPAFLAVLKRFGEGRGLVSFPTGGWTLALDLPAATPNLAPLLDELDELVAASGGRVYLAKDSRLRPDLVAAMYPGIRHWNEIRRELDPDGVMRSDLARRLSLTRTSTPATSSRRVAA
jgi:decaprenylphospho-beta-D-ribofuranose 2-oxidase